MNGMKWVFVCGLIVLFGNVFFPAHAQTPEAAKPKATSPAAPIAAEKSVLTDSATQAAKPEAATANVCLCVSQSDSASTKKIEQALAGPLHSSGIDYADQPLQDVVTQLSDEYRIPIQLDKPALEEAGIGTDSKVSVTLHNISLRSALKLTLRTLRLTWVIQDEVLMITTKESAEKDLDTCVYNVQGLVDDSDPKSVKALVDAIYGCVATDTWAINGGGQAEVRPLPSGLLVVSQTPALQEQVNALLMKIRKMREQAPVTKGRTQGPEPRPSHSSSGATKQTERVRSPAQSSGADNPFGG